MSKSIKVEEQVYEELDQIRGKGETFSDVVQDMLEARIRLLELMNVLEGQIKFREWQREQLTKAQAAD